MHCSTKLIDNVCIIKYIYYIGTYRDREAGLEIWTFPDEAQLTVFSI